MFGILSEISDQVESNLATAYLVCFASKQRQVIIAELPLACWLASKARSYYSSSPRASLSATPDEYVNGHSFARCSPTYTIPMKASSQPTTSTPSPKIIIPLPSQTLIRAEHQTLLPPNPQILATFPTPPLSPSSTLVFTLFAPPRSSNEHIRFSPSLLTSIAVHLCSLYANLFLPPPFLTSR